MINRILKFYIVLLSFLIILNLIQPMLLIKGMIIISLLFIPILFGLLNKRLFIVLVKSISLWLLSIIALGIGFRALRELAQQPQIDANKIVGYVQYFGYPIYFDSLVFNFIFILFIIIILVAIRMNLSKLANEK